jgi:4-diphosphocytidyl-2-C-methyl-D-erythritol kinase
MDILHLKAKAKINLSLDVLCRRPDGYHDLKMIMQTIGLHDTVTLEPAESGIQVICSNRYVPSGEGNIAWKAADLLLKKYDIKSGVRITINKTIPVAAGLAGVSTDAAAVLKGINKLYKLGISCDEIASLGLEAGADIPFCVYGGTMLAEGVGDKLTPLQPFDGVDIVLVKPRVSVSTAWVYKNLSLDTIALRPDTDKLVKAVEQKDISTVAADMKNVLESVTLQKHRV